MCQYASLFTICTTKAKKQKQESDKKLFILSRNIAKHIHIHQVSKQTKSYKVYVTEFSITTINKISSHDNSRRL